MIKLTTTYGTPVWVNPSFIASMVEDACGSAVFIAMDGNPTYVREKPEDILSKIQSIKEQ